AVNGGGNCHDARLSATLTNSHTILSEHLNLLILLQQSGVMDNAQVDNRVNRAPPGASWVEDDLNGLWPCGSRRASTQGVASAYRPVRDKLEVYTNVCKVCINHRVGHLLWQHRLTISQVSTNDGMQPDRCDALQGLFSTQTVTGTHVSNLQLQGGQHSTSGA